MAKEAPIDSTPAPDFSEPEATVPAVITFTVRDPNTGELVRSESDFVKPKEKKTDAPRP